MGEELECDREPENSCDHWPQKISRVCSLFLRRGGVISCTGTVLEIVQNRHGNYYSSSIDRVSTPTVSNVNIHVYTYVTKRAIYI